MSVNNIMHQNPNTSKVLSRFGQKVPLIYMMSGEFPYHMNLVHITEPKGLHRVTYQLDINKWLGCDYGISDEEFWEKNIRRISTDAMYHMIR